MKIVSDGPTGADRAALDAGLALGLAVSDWCPQGRRAEDGRIPDRYPPMETPKPGEPRKGRETPLSGGRTRIAAIGPGGDFRRPSICRGRVDERRAERG